MNNNEDSRVYIIGHRNPDTDSICSAIGYAYIKNQISPGENYIPCRAGSLNEESSFVLEHFGIPVPKYLDNVQTQIEDIDIRISHGVPEDVSLRQAWDLMNARNIVTLPIVEGEKLKGLITVKDLGRVYLDNNRSDLLSDANTPYQNVIEVLGGEMVVGDAEKHITKGKVCIGASEADILADYVENGDTVIVSNREELQRIAIKSGAACIIITMDAPVSDAIKELARERDCAVIATAYDTYIVSKRLNQSLPVRYGMIDDGIITFGMDDYIEDVKKIIAKAGHRDFPVINRDGDYVGMVSRRFLFDTRKKKVILVDHNEQSQAVAGIEEADILEIIDHHRLGSIETFHPVFFRNQPVGSTSTIIYKIALEYSIELDEKHAGLLCSGIISDTLLFRSPTTTESDVEAAMALAEIAKIELETFAAEMFHAGSVMDNEDPENIVLRDFKTYNLNDKALGIGQVNFMDGDALLAIQNTLKSHLAQVRKGKKLDVIFLLLTDISSGNSVVIFDGADTAELLHEAFEIEPNEGSVLLEGVVSRKKQFVPAILAALQN